jgi:polyisoprenoid-binding protein YceI
MLRRPIMAGTIAGLLLFVAAADASAQAVTRWMTAPQENEARYRVREQLAGIDFPSDAVGRTSNVQGTLALTSSGDVVADGTRFTIDAASIVTDSDRRDNFVRRNTLQTEEHPGIVFVPTSFNGLSFPLPASGEVQFRMLGDLTVRGVTRPVVWDVTATIANGALRGEAKTQFTFGQFQMEKPRVRSVLSVDDDIRLEYSFFLVPAR